MTRWARELLPKTSLWDGGVLVLREALWLGQLLLLLSLFAGETRALGLLDALAVPHRCGGGRSDEQQQRFEHGLMSVLRDARGKILWAMRHGTMAVLVLPVLITVWTSFRVNSSEGLVKTGGQLLCVMMGSFMIACASVAAAQMTFLLAVTWLLRSFCVPPNMMTTLQPLVAYCVGAATIVGREAAIWTAACCPVTRRHWFPSFQPRRIGSVDVFMGRVLVMPVVVFVSLASVAITSYALLPRSGLVIWGVIIGVPLLEVLVITLAYAWWMGWLNVLPRVGRRHGLEYTFRVLWPRILITAVASHFVSYSFIFILALAIMLPEGGASADTSAALLGFAYLTVGVAATLPWFPAYLKGDLGRDAVYRHQRNLNALQRALPTLQRVMSSL